MSTIAVTIPRTRMRVSWASEEEIPVETRNLIAKLKGLYPGKGLVVQGYFSNRNGALVDWFVTLSYQGQTVMEPEFPRRVLSLAWSCVRPAQTS